MARGQLYSDWCFTTKEEHVKEIEALQCASRYLIVGLEEGEDGYLHYQGFLQLQVRKRLETLKLLARTTHFEPRKGTVQQAIAYCKKGDGTPENPSNPCFFEMGEPTHQGERVDIKQFVEDSKATDRRSMYEMHPGCMVRYNRAYDDIQRTFAQAQPGARLVWIFGPSGVGKSDYVVSKYPGHYKKAPTDWWWQGYQGQHVVLIDEVTDAVPYATLLTLCDPGITRLPTKGGDIASQARLVFCTSNYSPDKVYARETGFKDRWDALLRRCAFFRCERTDVFGKSRLTQVKWQDGWQDTDQVKEFDVNIRMDQPSMAWLE